MDAVAKVAETEAEFLNILDEETIKDVLAEAFEEADKDGNGVLDVNEVQHVLKSLGVGQLALKPGEINAMIAAIDADEDGTVNYTELVDFLFDVLNHLGARAVDQGERVQRLVRCIRRRGRRGRLSGELNKRCFYDSVKYLKQQFTNQKNTSVAPSPASRSFEVEN